MSFGTVNCLTFLFYQACFWGLGRLAFGSNLPWRWLPAVGLALAGIVATLGYGTGLSIQAVGIVLAVGAVAGLFRTGRSFRSWRQPAFRRPWCVALVVAGLLLVPVLRGGLQFALFQGNEYDQFNYLGAAVVRTTQSHHAIATATAEEIGRLPLLMPAKDRLSARPAVVDLFAASDAVLPGNLYRTHSGYLAAILLTGFFALAGTLAALASGAGLWAEVIAAAWVLGFWGQLELDFNTWSWTAATPLMAALIGLVVTGVGGATRSRVFAGALLVGGLVYLYPEMLFFFGLPLVVGVAWTARQSADSSGRWREAAWVVGLAVLISVPALAQITAFVAKQVRFSTSTDYTPLDWMWRAIIGGPFPLASGAALVPGWIIAVTGLSWLPRSVASGWAELVVGVAALGAAVTWLLRRQTESKLQAAALVAAVALGEALILVALGYSWMGGKGITYAAVAVVPLLLLPIVSPRLSLISLPAWLLLAGHVVFALLRPWSAGSPSGVHYAGLPYPGCPDAELKETRTWDTGTMPFDLAGSLGVKIDLPDPWLASYASISLQSVRVPYYKVGFLREPWTFDRVGRDQPAMSRYDAVAFTEYNPANGHMGIGMARCDGAVFSAATALHLTRIESGQRLDTSSGMLAFRMGAKPVVLSLEAKQAGTARLSLAFRSDASAAPAFQLLLAGGDGALQVRPFGSLGPGVGTGAVFLIPVTRGANSVSLWVRAPVDPALSLIAFNPRLEPVAAQ
jgi:hypothetical protein